MKRREKLNMKKKGEYLNKLREKKREYEMGGKKLDIYWEIYLGKEKK